MIFPNQATFGTSNAHLFPHFFATSKPHGAFSRQVILEWHDQAAAATSAATSCDVGVREADGSSPPKLHGSAPKRPKRCPGHRLTHLGPPWSPAVDVFVPLWPHGVAGEGETVVFGCQGQPATRHVLLFWTELCPGVRG